ncbi:hypothetical protein CaCOL14_007154 [Colletotrichum acutatum]
MDSNNGSDALIKQMWDYNRRRKYDIMLTSAVYIQLNRAKIALSTSTSSRIRREIASLIELSSLPSTSNQVQKGDKTGNIMKTSWGLLHVVYTAHYTIAFADAPKGAFQPLPPG